MPLSEHEQRLLEQIERALYAEDPKFASTVRATDLKTHIRRRIRRSVLVFLLGLVLLMSGVIVKIVAVGVVGFLVMLSSALYAATSWKRGTSGGAVQAAGRPARSRRGGSSGRPQRTSWLERVEERWRRRWEERDR